MIKRLCYHYGSQYGRRAVRLAASLHQGLAPYLLNTGFGAASGAAEGSPSVLLSQKYSLTIRKYGTKNKLYLMSTNF